MKPNKQVLEIGEKRFKDLLRAGSFPEVQYEEHSCGVKYNMIEYSTVWSTFMKVVDRKLKEAGYKGIWTRKRSKKFVEDIKEIINKVEEQDVLSQKERFKTWCD